MCRPSGAREAGAWGPTPRWPPLRAASAPPGRRAAPASSQPISDDRSSAAGKATANRIRAWSSASWLSLSVAPTTTNARCPAAVTGTIRSRDRSRPCGRSSTNVGRRRPASSPAAASGARATAGVVSTILPEGVSTCANASSASISRRRPPPSDRSAWATLAVMTCARDCSPESTDAAQVGAQVDVDEHGDTDEHDGHPRRERQGKPDPKRRVRPADPHGAGSPTPLTVSSESPRSTVRSSFVAQAADVDVDDVRVALDT